MSRTKCSCCGAGDARKPEYHVPAAGCATLADLPVGRRARVARIMPKLRGRKKFADVGLVPGSELLMEARAPFGGLLRVRVMESSMALHRDDAAHIVMEAAE